MDELKRTLAAQSQAQGASAFVQLSEIRATRAVIWLAIGLLALANGWTPVGVPAFVCAAVCAYRAVSADLEARDALERFRTTKR